MRYELEAIKASINLRKEIYKLFLSNKPIELTYNKNLYYVYVEYECAMLYGLPNDKPYIIVIRANKDHKPLTFYTHAITYARLEDFFCRNLEHKIINSFLFE